MHFSSVFFKSPKKKFPVFLTVQRLLMPTVLTLSRYSK